MRAGIGIFICMFSSVVYREANPYVSKSANTMSHTAQWLLIVVFGAGVVVLGRPFAFDPLVLGFLMLVGHIGVLLAVIFAQPVFRNLLGLANAPGDMQVAPTTDEC